MATTFGVLFARFQISVVGLVLQVKEIDCQFSSTIKLNAVS